MKKKATRGYIGSINGIRFIALPHGTRVDVVLDFSKVRRAIQTNI